jgi:prophage regulatory protein
MAIAPNSGTNHNDRFLRWPEVQRRVGFSRSKVYSLIQCGKFPAQVKLGERASAWPESLIDEWIQARIAASATPKAGGEK